MLDATLGVELDSNATRLDAEAASGDPVRAALMRGHARARLRYRPLSDLAMGATYDLAGKVFFTEAARGQDTLIHRLTAGASVRLGDGLALRLGGLYHEGFQRAVGPGSSAGAGLFAFRLLDGRSTLALLPAPWLVGAVGLGVRSFKYKPDRALSFDALLATVLVDIHRTLGKGKGESELDLGLAYSLSRRRFSDEPELLCPSHVPGCELPDGSPSKQAVTFPLPGAHRQDMVHRLSVQLTWVRRVLVSGAYEYTRSLSGSFGFGYQRHELRAKVVAPLFWEIYGTAQLRARLVLFETNTVLLDDPGFEEENLSHLLVQLERRLVGSFSLVLRYTLFLGDLISPRLSSLRHLVFVGCALRKRSP